MAIIDAAPPAVRINGLVLALLLAHRLACLDQYLQTTKGVAAADFGGPVSWGGHSAGGWDLKFAWDGRLGLGLERGVGGRPGGVVRRLPGLEVPIVLLLQRAWQRSLSQVLPEGGLDLSFEAVCTLFGNGRTTRGLQAQGGPNASPCCVPCLFLTMRVVPSS